MLSDSIIRGNSSTTHGFGGGIVNRGTLNIIRSTTTENVAGFTGGGGIWNTGGDLVLTDSTVSNNQGAGLRNDFNHQMTVLNSTISGNIGFGGGGIVTFDTGTITVTNSTVSNNIATYDFGGGLSNREYYC